MQRNMWKTLNFALSIEPLSEKGFYFKEGEKYEIIKQQCATIVV
jgi:hypothetical protein